MTRIHRVDSDQLRPHVTHLRHGPASLDRALETIGDASLVLLGEATHGSHEFYDLRAQLTRRLLEEKGFDAVAVEADWPDAYRVNRYVRGQGDDGSAREALAGFQRFPQWMWRNTVVVGFIEWLAAFNEPREVADRVGFYGLDLYSLYRSAEAVIQYLDRVDPEAGRRARARYGCFDHSLGNPQEYGYQAGLGLREDCSDEAVEQLIELEQGATEYLRRDGLVAADEQFFAEQNAQVVANAEAYYRAMFTGRSNTWNLRDRHMSTTLTELRRHLREQGRAGRIVVWEHNSHIGDARATSMGARGELNVGQLVREAAGGDAMLIGFTTYDGTVAAASDWDAPVELKSVRPAIQGSIEHLFHELGGDLFLPTGAAEVGELLSRPLYERAIGVIYRPQTEMASHYFQARVAEQFDGVFHIDRTQALQPLDLTPAWEPDRVPETYPFGT
ncbi:erythromycin esterase family protein [Thioalkalivibrio sp.]|uniref:erythromycin esterase family protein n=1 Tax=Thioalkalivibrio sp. TaxID=2093813 RepID=UPI0039751620